MAETSPDSAETQRLLEQVRAGDRDAFERLFARHRPYLHQVVGWRLDPRLRPRVDPSDVVQETELEAFRRLDDFLQRRPMSFRLWLRKTVCERLLMLERQHIGAARRSVRREIALPEGSSLQLAERFLAAGLSPSQQLSRSELAQLVRQAVAELPEPDREILLMRNVEVLSNREVAEVLQIEPAAASRRYGRALLRLRKLLIERGLTEADHA
jgi:RNA polymerase sigma-70 factor, ECF subfamily